MRIGLIAMSGGRVKPGELACIPIFIAERFLKVAVWLQPTGGNQPTMRSSRSDV